MPAREISVSAANMRGMLSRYPDSDDAEGQAGAFAGGASCDFGHDGTDQRQAASDAKAAQEVRQRARQSQVDQLLPPRRPIEVHQFHKPVVGGGEPQGRVRQDREKRDQEGADQNGRA